MQSKYSEIWNLLKTVGHAKIAAPQQYHKALKKAIMKRKDKDLKFKFDLSEQRKIPRLKFIVSGNIMEVYLTLKPDPFNL